MNGQVPGKARLSAQLDRVPASEVKAQPVPPKKTGVEVVVEKGWKRDADSKPEDRTRVIDHDNNRVLFDGTKAEWSALKRAAQGKE